MVRRDDESFGFGGVTGGAVAWPLPLMRAGASIAPRRRWPSRVDWVVDLGDGIGSLRWCRGAATLGVMVAALVAVAPGLGMPESGAGPTVVHPIAVRPIAPIVMPTSVPDRSPAASSDAPVRLTGQVDGGLYRSLLAAGAAPSVAADFIDAVATRVDLGTIASADRFDLVVRDKRLLYAGIVHDGKPLSLLRWTIDGQDRWFDAAGMGPPGDGFTPPVADARLSSGFGMRFHPILGFSRMHQGVDLAAPLGTPIVSAAEGIVRFAGAHGGYGNFVQIQHDGGLGTGYGHMSGIVVRPGAIVRQGELLGYVGSTGMSTGPHCHFEVYRDGAAVDPQTASFSRTARLGGTELQQFRAALARVTALPPTLAP